MGSSDRVWEKLSSQWKQNDGQPLHPGPEDRKYMEKAIHDWTPKENDLSALILGVTPQITRLNWPDGTNLLAADHSQQMIDRVWPGYPNPGEGAIRADWLDLPLDSNTRDIVVSDAPFGVLPYPHMYKILLHSVRRMLKPNGIFAFRIFIRPNETEEPEQIFKDALEKKIGNFHAFKLRMLMSMQPNTETGVCIGDVWNYWENQKINHHTFAKKTGWPIDHIETMKAYKNQRDVYHFPTHQQLLDLMTLENFSELHSFWPTYELGECCPTFVYKPEPSDQ